MFFFFNDTATTEIYTLSLHDALPICQRDLGGVEDLVAHSRNSFRMAMMPAGSGATRAPAAARASSLAAADSRRSEEHTSELQSRQYLVCRLLLEKKKKKSTDLIYVLE